MSVIAPDQARFSSGPCASLAPPDLSNLVAALRHETVHIVQHEGLWLYGLRVPGTPLIAGGIFVESEESIPRLQAAARRAGMGDEAFQNWLQRHSQIRPDLAQRLLDSAVQLMQQRDLGHETIRTRDAVVNQLGQVYEEVALVHELAQYLRPDIDPLALTEIILERILLVTQTELAAVCLNRNGNLLDTMCGPWELSAGDLREWLRREQGNRSPHIMVRNHRTKNELDGGRGIRCLAAIPLFPEDAEPSWIVVANTVDQRELGTEEANLLRSVGGILATQIRVVELFREQDSMVLAFIRSLVATLDAKDSYTRGHSERVALIAERIARQMNLSEHETLAIFQAGLLHDLGKIGVSDALLLKTDSLSEAEFQLIAKHPEVGHNILSELRGLTHLLPGVRHHHERFDGRGYPDRLAGKAIPRAARILAVADSFDAMGSNRPYRVGKPLEDVERILTSGAGSQWDPDVVSAYFAARTDIHRIWNSAIERQNASDLRNPSYAREAQLLLPTRD